MKNLMKLEALKKIRDKKDARVSEYESDSERSFREMLDDKEDYSDLAEEGMSMEEKEDKAKEILMMKRRELGYLK